MASIPYSVGCDDAQQQQGVDDEQEVKLGECTCPFLSEGPLSIACPSLINSAMYSCEPVLSDHSISPTNSMHIFVHEYRHSHFECRNGRRGEFWISPSLEFDWLYDIFHYFYSSIPRARIENGVRAGEL